VLNLDNIQESTILAIYDDIIDLQILMRYPWVFHYDDIQELVIVDDDWHLNILLILPISSTFPHSFGVACDMMISINISLTIDNVTIFSIRFDYSAFDDIHN
jgi:hypothetical protein